MIDQRLNVIDCIQGDDTWLLAKCGSLGGSRVADAITKLKRKEGEAACRRELRGKIVAERLTGRSADNYVSPEMLWGVDTEPLARAAYEQLTGQDVDLVGFVLHPTIKWAGVSPDGLVGTDGMVEFKCPKTTTHLEYLLNDCVPSEYIPQMQWEMACCPGRMWNDFVSHDPRLPDDLATFICRLPRDEAYIASMEAEVRQFLAEVDEMIQRLKCRNLEGALRASIEQVQARNNQQEEISASGR